MSLYSVYSKWNGLPSSSIPKFYWVIFFSGMHHEIVNNQTFIWLGKIHVDASALYNVHTKLKIKFHINGVSSC